MTQQPLEAGWSAVPTPSGNWVLPVPQELAAMRQRGTRLARVGGGDGGEALAVVGGAANAVQAKLRVVDGEHDLGPPQPVAVILIPESTCFTSGLRAVTGAIAATQNHQSTACPIYANMSRGSGHVSGSPKLSGRDGEARTSRTAPGWRCSSRGSAGRPAAALSAAGTPAQPAQPPAASLL